MSLSYYFFSSRPSYALWRFIVLFFLVLWGGGAPISQAASSQDASTFVTKLGDQTLAIIQDGQKSAADKERALIALFQQNIDTEWIGKFVLGKYWSAASPTQQQQYLDVYKKFLVQSYVPHFREYTGETFAVVSVAAENKGEFLVQTTINRPDHTTTRVDYRIREAAKPNQPFLVFDIIAEGISLIVTQRSDFNAILAEEGMASLIAKLKAKVLRT